MTNMYAVVYKTAAEWAAGSFVLKGDASAGQEGIESDTGKRKLGPGAYNSLPYLPTPATTPSGSAGGALAGTYPNPSLAPLGANLDANGHKITGLTPGAGTGEAVEYAQMVAAISAAVTGLLDFKGATDASANPNYPAASKGDAYVVSVGGKIGGASGKSVDVGDLYLATADNAGGTEASVGTSWSVLEHNLVGALLAANNGSDIPSPATFRTNLGLAIGTDVEAHDPDLTTIAGLTPTNDDLLQRKAGGWINRTPAQVRTDVGALAPDIQTFSASGTWNKPTGAKLCLVGVTAPGGGGGSGRRGASAAVRGGGSGAGGGQRVWAMIDASVLASSETVTIGAGGTGGAAQSTNATDGNPGTDGGTASFGAWLTALGGKGGLGGTNTGGTAGGAAQFPGGTVGGVGGIAGGSGGSADGATGKGTLNCAGAGGGGGGLSAASAESAGGAGAGNPTTPTGVAGGAVRTNGNPGTSSPTGDYVPGGGGSGGGSGDAAGTIAGGTGGVGGTPGGGGAGGGGSTNGANSGAGGAGGPGRVLVVTYF